jgi:transposase InsO family protein
MEAIPLTNTAATSVAAELFSGWISRFCVLDTITSDRGPQFTSNIWNSLCLLLQIKHQPTAPFHPQANGMVERLHRRLKDALRTRGANATWAAELPWVLLGLRSLLSAGGLKHLTCSGCNWHTISVAKPVSKYR